MLASMLALACYYFYRNTEESKKSDYPFVSVYLLIGIIVGLVIGIFSGSYMLEYLNNKNMISGKGNGIAFMLFWTLTISIIFGFIASITYGHFMRKTNK